MKRPQVHTYYSDLVSTPAITSRCRRWFYVCTERPWGLPLRHTPEYMKRSTHIYYDNRAAHWLRWEKEYNG